MADSSPVPESFRLEQPIPAGKPLERRTFRSKTEQAQMTMFCRKSAGKDGRDRTAGIAELHIDFFAGRQKFLQKIVIIDDLPAQSIYK